ncbi:histidine phosphatase family protein [Sporolactobacillus sp. Y61]|uniref:Histidine phosphatase family protein n=1 Tax=Sporolactobacillus sp. Y61 TaxID=3160863 RepID=A0AAU8IFR2_9BACL
MTIIYFVRHAESDARVHNDRCRPLTGKGLKDRTLVTDFLQDKDVNTVFSSPYQRALDTIRHFTDKKGMPIHHVPGFRERTIGQWVDDFQSYAKRQWADFQYKLPAGKACRKPRTVLSAS